MILIQILFKNQNKRLNNVIIKRMIKLKEVNEIHKKLLKQKTDECYDYTLNILTSSLPEKYKDKDLHKKIKKSGNTI